MSDRAPEVSVVMGVRDAGEALDATLDSVLDQEGVELELVVVDDGSTDETPQRLAARAARDPRLRVLRQDAAGLTAALIRGCAAARAPLIARQDAGDRSLPGRLRRQRDAFQRHPEVVLVSCWTECVAPEGEPLGTERGTVPADRAVDLLRREGDGWSHVGPTSHGSAVFRRDSYDAAGGYRSEFALGQDWDLWLRLGELGPYLCVGETLYRRSIDPESLSFVLRATQMRFGELSTEASRERLAGRTETAPLREAAALSSRLGPPPARARRQAVARGQYHVGELLRRRGDRSAARYLRRAVRHDPLLLRAWWKLLLSRRAETRDVE